jgi:hypothetical protein
MKRSWSHERSLVLGVMLAASACGTDALLGPEAPQGIDGLVLLGPQCPVQTLDDPCADEPYAAWINVRDAGGGLVGRVQSGDDGRFRVGLRPGSYVLDPESGSPFPIASAQDVRVEPGSYADVLVSFDTGIR